MPSSGDIKWRKAGDLTTKQQISDAVDVAASSKDWAIKVAKKYKANPLKAKNLLSIAIALAGVSAAVFYSQYETALERLLEEIEKLPKNQKFCVEQKFKWHPGHRGWMPVAAFRVLISV